MADLNDKFNGFLRNNPELIISLLPNVFESNDIELGDGLWNAFHDVVIPYIKQGRVKSEGATYLFCSRFDYLLKKQGGSIESDEVSKFFSDISSCSLDIQSSIMNNIIGNLMNDGEIGSATAVMDRISPSIVTANAYRFLFNDEEGYFDLIVDFFKKNPKSIKLNMDTLLSGLTEQKFNKLFSEVGDVFPINDLLVISSLKFGLKNNKAYMVDYFWDGFVDIVKNPHSLSEENYNLANNLIIRLVSSGSDKIYDFLGTDMVDKLVSTPFTLTNSLGAIPAKRFDGEKSINFKKGFNVKGAISENEKVNLLEHSLYTLNTDSYDALSSYYGGLDDNNIDKIKDRIKKFHSGYVDDKDLNKFFISLDHIILNKKLPLFSSGKSVLKI